MTILTLVTGVPIPLPVLPECMVRDIAETILSAFQACYTYWAPLVDGPDGKPQSQDNFTCPDCPGQLPLIDCRSVGFKTPWDEFLFGLHWISSWFYIPRAILPALPNGLNLDIERHQACFIWLLPSLSFWLGILVGLAILITGLLAALQILLASVTRLTSLRIFTRCM